MQEIIKLKELESYISAALSVKLEPGQYRLIFSFYRRRLFISSVMTINNGQKVRLNKMPILLAKVTFKASIQTPLSKDFFTDILFNFLKENNLISELTPDAMEKYLAIAMNDFFEKYATYPPKLN